MLLLGGLSHRDFQRLGTVFTLSLSLAGCSYDISKTKEAIGPLSFAAIKQNVLEPRCLNCHNGLGQWSCGDYKEVKLRLEKVNFRVLEKKDMPPGPGLSPYQYNLLTRWIQAGAPEFGKDATPPEKPPEKPPPMPLEPKFASIKENIFVPMCIFCHEKEKGNPLRYVPLNTKGDLLNSPRLLVLPGNADESGLFLSVRPKARKPMPPVDSGMRRLNATEVSVIVNWINAGAQD